MNYYDRPEISNSFLIAFDRSPAHAFTHRETDAMAMGSMIHKFILEPKDFEKEYMITEKINRNTNIYKDLVKSNPDKTILFPDEVSDLVPIAMSVNETVFEGKKISEWMKESAIEAELFFDYNGVRAKSKLDIHHPRFIFDLKKTQDARDFLYAVKKYKLYRQVAFYKKNTFANDWNERRGIFIVVEEAYPFGVMLYELTDDWILQGDIENEMSIEKYKKWVEAGSDRNIVYPDGVHVLDMPEYMRGG